MKYPQLNIASSVLNILTWNECDCWSEVKITQGFLVVIGNHSLQQKEKWLKLQMTLSGTFVYFILIVKSKEH